MGFLRFYEDFVGFLRIETSCEIVKALSRDFMRVCISFFGASLNCFETLIKTFLGFPFGSLRCYEDFVKIFEILKIFSRFLGFWSF